MQRSYLRKMRSKKKLTIEQAAKLIGISRQTMGCIENGTKNPSLKVINALEDFYGIPQRELLKKDEE